MTDQCQSLRANERLPGATEVLEPAFGKQKLLERSPTKTGFTSLLLGLGAAVGSTSAKIVHQVLENCGIKHVQSWSAQHLGTTLQSKRQWVYTPDKSRMNPQNSQPEVFIAPAVGAAEREIRIEERCFAFEVPDINSRHLSSRPPLSGNERQVNVCGRQACRSGTSSCWSPCWLSPL